MEALFVYGTLRASADHPMGRLLRDHARLVGRGHIRARLYVIDDPDEPGQNFYPGALPSPDPEDRVHGEVYEVVDPEAVFPAFDRYEACSPDHPEPHEFILREVPVTMEDGATLRARSYLYSWDVGDAERVTSGRYEDRAPDVR
ncbi:gamma-glutamylcyclotransferase family protein [Pseudaestuariivita atlantica]|uniref:Gamma-glutamylcyclotransferase AIG2-like domain-containing protein n=1 Tax=Pseudaestuariivita atlantica TaxID=1317121 RepID=A0A0L1JV06_9RHOB|nr:gamma-glutamylcyclotransferase family protein [Pseudaestuariivita atlantica]KNG95601.1 hypothetical protein ATO11_03205 [Pseudaestuariivita atlantica]